VYDTSSFMPPQAPPIDRTPSGAGAFSTQSRVDASTLFASPFGTVGTGSWSWKPGCTGSWSECLIEPQQYIL
jgi:hypothetical protein